MLFLARMTHPWDSSSENASLNETIDLYGQPAEMHQSWDQANEAIELVEAVFNGPNASSSRPRARPLRASILSEKGFHAEALETLFGGLEHLGIKIRRERTWAECDRLWNQLSNYLRKTDLETLFGRPMTEDRSLLAITVLLKAAISLSLWTAPCLFLNLAVELTNLYIFRDAFPLTNFICLTNAYIAYIRFKDLELGRKLRDSAAAHTEQADKSAYDNIIDINFHTITINQMYEPLADTVASLESARHDVECAGYQTPLINHQTIVAFSRFALGHDMAELEAFCDQTDINLRWRGVVYIIATR